MSYPAARQASDLRRGATIRGIGSDAACARQIGALGRAAGIGAVVFAQSDHMVGIESSRLKL